MSAASRGDPQEAFARMILKDHGDALRRYLGRKGVLVNDIEDVLQDVVRMASRSRDTYDPERSLRAWLRGIAANAARHYRRRLMRRPRPMPDDELAVIVDGDPDPEELMIQRDRLAMLDRMMRSVPEVQRDVLMQHKLQEIPMPVIAKAAGISLEKAWSYCKEAEARCRAWLRRWRAAERAKGRDGRPLVLLPLLDAMDSLRRRSARSRFARLAGRIFVRAAVALPAMCCASFVPGGAQALVPTLRVDVVALDAAVLPQPAPDPSPAPPPVALPSARRAPAGPPARVRSVRGAPVGLEDLDGEDVEIMVLQAEVERDAGNDAEALRLLMDHGERRAAPESEAKRNKLLREVAGRLSAHEREP